MVSDELHPGREGLRTVLLRHVMADGSWHYDWMFESRRGGPLTTFRVGVRLDVPAQGQFHAERIGDHRSTYLEYQGEVGQGRGRVTRVAEGTLGIRRETAEELSVMVSFGAEGRLWRGLHVGGALWKFESQVVPAAR